MSTMPKTAKTLRPLPAAHRGTGQGNPTHSDAFDRAVAVHPDWLVGKAGRRVVQAQTPRQTRSVAGLVAIRISPSYPLSRSLPTRQLVEPAVQRVRFEAQVALTAAGDDEVIPPAEDLTTAMRMECHEWRHRNGDRTPAHGTHRFVYPSHLRFRWYDHNGWVDFAFCTEMG